MKKILILSPHTDDAEFGCGASIAKWIKEEKDVAVIAFSYVSDIRLKEEMVNAMAELKVMDYQVCDFPTRDFLSDRQEILELMVEMEKKYEPELVVLPTTTDTHQDHQVISQEGFRAFKRHSIIGYEMPCNNLDFRTNMFVELGKDNLYAKMRALKCYKSQKERPYANGDYIWSLAKIRGVQVGKEFAEAFEVIRWIR